MFSTKKHAKALPLQLAVDILQIPVSVVFGYFIDLTMYLLFWVEPQGYAVKLVAVLSLLFFGWLNGVREGIIASLRVGFFAKVFGKRLAFIKPYILP